MKCLACHAQPGRNFRLDSGERLPLFVSEARFRKSVHGNRLTCKDCHTATNPDKIPHTRHPRENRRAYTLILYEVCKRCHFENYTKTLDSVHFSALRSGKDGAPVCSDCHNPHAVQKPGLSRGRDSSACRPCHHDIVQRYAGSVHGKALLDENNVDVPGCTTCHGVHNIIAANSAAFRLASTRLCSRCHENASVMAKYGLPANTLKTYLEDFHGRTVRFKQQQGEATTLREPLCIDCHGFHDIKPVHDPASPVVRSNLQKTCQKCHKNAGTSFPDAWMGHYEPGPRKAPLVYAIRWLYLILIPVLAAGLGLHVGMDIWRVVKNR